TIVKATWQKWFLEAKKGTDFDTFWHQSIESGVVAGTASPVVPNVTVTLDGQVKAAPAIATKAGELELQFRADPTIYDGRFNNVGWLQELPKPITKITWDNTAIMSPATADKLKVQFEFKYTGGEQGRTEIDKVEIKIGGQTLKIAAFILPGHADDVITLHLGYGRTNVGEVGKNTGFNTYSIRSTTNFGFGAGAEVTGTREKYFVACTQGQHAMEGRRPARHGTVNEVKEELAAIKKHEKHAFEFADNPPVAAAEKALMRPLLPGTPEERERLVSIGWLKKDPHEHKHDHEHAHEHKHDERLLPLTLVDDVKVNKQYRRWAMAIDLGACTGCSACVVACVAENNIPVLGKEEVTRGRAMHWIRVDRYFSVTEENGGTKRVNAENRWELLKAKNVPVALHFQPVNCQQCEKAPCEVVCPVGATIHSNDGLNDMAYNRCVGTRYCSNNCPYKVRRFNFMQYANYDKDTTLKLVNNPEVTVRTRGVMEKCTYCVQRIRNAEIEAEREHANPNRPKAAMPDGSIRPVILEGEIVTACQAACPAKAISFGDLNYDQYEVGGKRLPMSEVARWKYEPTNYGLLAELNTMPRTSYLAAVKNPNPNMPKMPKGA
ncbi:MAG: 4Fe-4S dicluster domain-containing protein, partial [Gemmataceae bacterium]